VKYIDTIDRVCPHCQGREFVERAKGRDFEYHTFDNEFVFVSCKSCGLVFLNPMPMPARLKEVYPANYKPFHFNKNDKSFIFKVRDFLEARKAGIYRKFLPSQARIMDVGCGDGRYMTILKKVGPFWDIEGVDFGEAAIKRAQEKGLKAICGAYETTDLGREQYDLIILNQVIEHLPEPCDVVRKIHGELKPGGILSLETPSLDGWDADLFKEKFWGGYHFPRHLVLFNEETIRDFLKKRGFRVISVKYLVSPVFWVFSLHHRSEDLGHAGTSFWSDSNPVALGLATLVDLIQLLIRRKTSNMQVIAKKE
jgi:2-polyprenyl-3-methyl-5-hydroxy-6-metoxy-1,4-benzoquinol methylase